MNRFNRVLLKLSGEALKGDLAFGYQPEAITDVVERITKVVNSGVEVAIVVGAGNLWRGLAGSSRGMDRVRADQMGMLATMMNALAKSILNRLEFPPSFRVPSASKVCLSVTAATRRSLRSSPARSSSSPAEPETPSSPPTPHLWCALLKSTATQYSRRPKSTESTPPIPLKIPAPSVTRRSPSMRLSTKDSKSWMHQLSLSAATTNSPSSSLILRLLKALKKLLPEIPPAARS